MYPESSQVRLVQLEKASDSDIWYHAKTHDFVIVTKDSDIVDLAVLRGAPPKIVWLRVGNSSTKFIEQLPRSSKPAIEELLRDASRSVLELLA